MVAFLASWLSMLFLDPSLLLLSFFLALAIATLSFWRSPKPPEAKEIPLLRGQILPHSLHIDTEGKVIFWIIEEFKLPSRRVVVKHILSSCLAGMEFDETGSNFDVLGTFFVPFEGGIIAANKANEHLCQTIPESEVSTNDVMEIFPLENFIISHGTIDTTRSRLSHLQSLVNAEILCVMEESSSTCSSIVALNLSKPSSRQKIASTKSGGYAGPRVSPDGRWCVFIGWDKQNGDSGQCKTELRFCALDPARGTSLACYSAVLPNGEDAFPQQPRPAPDGSGFFFISSHSGWRNVYFLPSLGLQPHHSLIIPPRSPALASSHPSSPPHPRPLHVAIEDVYLVPCHCAGADNVRLGRWDYDVGLICSSKRSSAVPNKQGEHALLARHSTLFVVVIERLSFLADDKSPGEKIVVVSQETHAPPKGSLTGKEPQRIWSCQDVSASLSPESIPLPCRVESVRCFPPPLPFAFETQSHSRRPDIMFFVIGREKKNSECAVFEVSGSAEATKGSGECVFSCRKVSNT